MLPPIRLIARKKRHLNRELKCEEKEDRKKDISSANKDFEKNLSTEMAVQKIVSKLHVIDHGNVAIHTFIDLRKAFD